MIANGLNKIAPDRRDYSLLHTFGAVTPDPAGLPATFSIYDGRPIPNQNSFDTRFSPALPPLPYGCTGETGAFESGLQDGTLYTPKDLYDNTPPGGSGGRDMRAMLKTLISRGPRNADGTFGPKREAFFNVYGAGKIDDCDAARIALWINQYERRGVYVGSWWYSDFEAPEEDGTLPVPSFKTAEANLHAYLLTGWRTNNGIVELEAISWQGTSYGAAGLAYLTRPIYNALLLQPYTGSFTITKMHNMTPVPIGLRANYDHIIYSLTQLIRNLFHV